MSNYVPQPRRLLRLAGADDEATLERSRHNWIAFNEENVNHSNYIALSFAIHTKTPGLYFPYFRWQCGVMSPRTCHQQSGHVWIEIG